VFSSPVHAGGLVYVGSEDHHMYALHAHNGTVAWKIPVEGPVSTSAAIGADGTLYFAAGGALYAVFKQLPRGPGGEIIPPVDGR